MKYLITMISGKEHHVIINSKRGLTNLGYFQAELRTNPGDTIEPPFHIFETSDDADEDIILNINQIESIIPD